MSSTTRADPSRPWSITRRLASLFTLVTALLLAGAMAVVWFALARHADEEDARFLRERVSQLRRELRGGGAPESLVKPATGEVGPFLVRVENAASGVRAESPEMSAFAPSAAFDGASVERPREWRAKGKWLLLAAADEAGWRVQVAQDRTEDREFMVGFAWLLGALVFTGVALAASLARAVTRRGLRPLAEMAAAAARIHAAQLHERLAPAGWPDELCALATAFDAMLSRLDESFTRLSQFSADLAHELRTPLFNLRGEAEIALTQARTPEAYRDVLASSLEELDRLSRMIESLLFVARAEQPQPRIARQSLDARTEAEVVRDFHEAAAEEQGVRLIVEGTACVDAEPAMLRRTLTNLVTNALAHTPRGGTVTVRVAEESGEAIFTVSDTGPGIAPEHLPRIFDRFYRADPARGGGAGLGLAIAKSIAELHGGTLTAASGPGATFTLMLPRAAGN